MDVYLDPSVRRLRVLAVHRHGQRANASSNFVSPRLQLEPADSAGAGVGRGLDEKGSESAEKAGEKDGKKTGDRAERLAVTTGSAMPGKRVGQKLWDSAQR